MKSASCFGAINIRLAFSLFLVSACVSCGKQEGSQAVAANSKDSESDHYHAEWEMQKPRLFSPPARIAKLNRNDPEYVRAWNWFTTVEDYRLTGKTNALWDQPAIAAMEAYAELRVLKRETKRHEEVHWSIYTNSITAVKAGCDDPLVIYLHTRFVESSDDDRAAIARRAEAYDQAGVKMDQTTYSPIRKMYVHLRAAEATLQLVGGKTNMPEALWNHRMEAIHHLAEALHDSMMPPTEAAQVCAQVYDTMQSNTGARGEIEMHLLPVLETHWKDHGFTWLLKGRLYIDKGWDSRGGGFASSVTQQGWKGFQENIDKAEKLLETAWKIDKKDAAIPTYMISVCMAKGYPRSKMERWFERAMEIDPQCYAAAQKKALFLDPKWHGSPEELLAFGRECAASEKWGGRVPLLLVDLHTSIDAFERGYEADSAKSAAYWSRPSVWKDMKLSYEKYLQLYPNDETQRYYYAYEARRHKQHREFLDQISKLTEPIDQKFFGGEKAFADSMQEARDGIANEK